MFWFIGETRYIYALITATSAVTITDITCTVSALAEGDLAPTLVSSGAGAALNNSTASVTLMYLWTPAVNGMYEAIFTYKIGSEIFVSKQIINIRINPTHLEELIEPLRIHINDTANTPTYSDEFLLNALLHAVDALMPRWNNKYVRDATGIVVRNPYNAYTFDFPEPPRIQYQDRRAIILQASISLKSGTQYNMAQTSVSWRDEEISYNNTSSIQDIKASLELDKAELKDLFPIKLARTRKQSLPGYNNNPYEKGDG